MALFDTFDRVLNFTRASVDIAKGGGDPASLVINLRERLQTLREDLLTLREEAATLREEKREVEERLANLSNFESERHMYMLVTLESGGVVYVPKESGSGEHQGRIYLCANCFEESRRKILQVQSRNYEFDTYYCPACKATVQAPSSLEPGLPMTTSSSTRGF